MTISRFIGEWISNVRTSSLWRKIPGRFGLRWRAAVKLLAGLVLCVALVNHIPVVYGVIQLRSVSPGTTALMEQRLNEARARNLEVRKEFIWVPYERISPALVRAVLAGEDIRFFQHHGIDWKTLRLAIAQNVREKRFSRGASTIAQQLAKNLFLSSSKNLMRKLHEAIIAYELTYVLDKRRVLELYLNVIEWGDGVYGAEAAARFYYGVSASELNDEQAAFLAAIIPNPRAENNPAASSGPTLERTYRILGLMQHPLLNHPLLGPKPASRT